MLFAENSTPIEKAIKAKAISDIKDSLDESAALIKGLNSLLPRKSLIVYNYF